MKIEEQNLDNPQNSQLNIPVVMCRYCVSLMYDKTGVDSKGRYIDYRIESMVVNAENADEAKLIVVNRLKDKMKEWTLCVDTTVEV
jgi:hypothetical protein